MKEFFIVVLALVSQAAFAEEGGPCREDVKKFCGDVKPGGGAVVKCMKEHEAKLSEGCRAFAAEKKDELKEKFGQAKEACAADKEKFCKDVKAGGGAIVKCMKSHEAELSEACRATLPKRKRK